MRSKPLEAIHLGDGAYASEGRYRGELIITANHHDPDQATDRVYLNSQAIKSLAGYIERIISADD
jgi:hypothetical protein